MRRISQRYVIATSTKIDMSNVKIPDNINDEFFARKREKRAKKEEGNIFQSKKEVSKDVLFISSLNKSKWYIEWSTLFL